MKLILPLLLFPLLSLSQLQIKQSPKMVTIGQVATFTGYIALTKITGGGDTAYSIMYKNEKYKNITDMNAIVFKDENNAFELLYQLLMSFYDTENPKRNANFKLGVTDVFITKDNARLLISTSDGYFRLGKKEIEKLFNR